MVVAVAAEAVELVSAVVTVDEVGFAVVVVVVGGFDVIFLWLTLLALSLLEYESLVYLPDASTRCFASYFGMP